MGDYKTTRRGTLTGAAAILAGCSTETNENSPEPSEQPKDENNTQPTPPENNTDPSEKGKDTDDEKEEQSNTWNWNDVLEEEQIHRKNYKIQDLAERALEGEEIEQDFTIDFSKNRHNYTHGGHTFNREHFLNHNTDTFSGLLDAASDAITVGVHYIQEHENEGFPSEWRSEIGATAEKILQQGPNLDNIHIWGAGNDGHGFNYILSEQHGVALIDTTTNKAGRAGTDPLEDAPYGYDIVSRFEESWLNEDSDVPNFKGSIAQNFATNSMYDILGRRANQRNVGVHLDLLPNVFDKFEAEDSGEFLWNQYRPAVATSVYKREAEDFEEDKGIVINPDKLEDLPDLRNYSNFTEYLSDLETQTEILQGEEAIGPVYLP